MAAVPHIGSNPTLRIVTGAALPFSNTPRPHSFPFLVPFTSHVCPMSDIIIVWSAPPGDLAIVLSPLTGNATALKEAVAQRPASELQTCTSCALDLAAAELYKWRRAAARPRVVLLTASFSGYGGGAPQDLLSAQSLHASGIEVLIVQFAPDAGAGVLFDFYAEQMASQPSSVFRAGSSSTPISDLITLNTTTSYMSKSCTQVHYACATTATQRCEEPATLVVHGKGFYQVLDRATRRALA